MAIRPQTISLLWQLKDHKRIGFISELLYCCTIVLVTFNLMHTQIFKHCLKPRSLLDDPHSFEGRVFVLTEPVPGYCLSCTF